MRVTDDPITNPTASPSAEPTQSPSTPSTELTLTPTQSPSTEPTKTPSTDPTISPSTEPTDSPTQSGSDLFYDFINVAISGFDGFSASELRYDFALQNVIANITHFAIAQSAADYGVDGDSFAVDYHSVSSPLSIVHTIYADTRPILNVLLLVIGNEDAAISTEIETKIAARFVNGTVNEGMTVSIGFIVLSHLPFEDVMLWKVV